MNTLDIVILILLVSAVFRGFEIGLIRQFFSTASFAGGLVFGAWLQQYTVGLATTPLSRSLTTVLTTLGCAFGALLIGEVVGGRLKTRLQARLHGNRFDGYLGSVIGVVTLLAATWLAAGVISALPSEQAQAQVRGSYIVTTLNRSLPPTPGVIAKLGSLIDPNGFPQVFTGSEPERPENTVVPGISPALQAAIDKAKVSTVKLESLGCGGIVNGSGFVISSDLVVTNAHVIAGVKQPYVKDANGQHSATVIWFDPQLDFAIVRAQNLAGPPLLLADNVVPRQTRAAIIGYPGGGPLTAGGAEVLDDFNARGRDIYGNGITVRDVYSLAGKVIPGNSGGPLITADGTVIGIIFAQSTSYENVGYALSTPQVEAAISQAQAQNRAVSTGSCAE